MLETQLVESVGSHFATRAPLTCGNPHGAQEEYRYGRWLGDTGIGRRGCGAAPVEQHLVELCLIDGAAGQIIEPAGGGRISQLAAPVQEDQVEVRLLDQAVVVIVSIQAGDDK